MKTPTVSLMLKNIQALFESETGVELAETTRTQLESLLNDAIKNTVGLAKEDNFSSREVTVVLTDLRGFTSISEEHSAPVLLNMLNHYLIKMSAIAIGHGGTIDKFMGDAIMVLFGAPFSHQDDVQRAVHCAVDMQLAICEINKHHKEIGMPELNMGIGINTGHVMAGLLGSDLYTEYTVIGDEVNLASRIEAYSLRGQVLISESTHARVRDFVTVSEPMDVYVKGKKNQINLFEVLEIPSLGKKVPRQEIRKSPRVETHMPFVFHVVEDKIVLAKENNGIILDLSYNGVLATVDCDLPAQSDIKMHMNFSMSGTMASDVYARVLRTFERDGKRMVCIEFTSVSVQSNMNIRQFVQMLIQGGVIK